MNAVLFIADTQLATLLRSMAAESNEFEVGTIAELTMTGYPLARTFNTAAPDVILLEMTDFDRDFPQAAAIRKAAPDVPIVGLASRDAQMMIDRGIGAEIHALAVWPFTVPELEIAIGSAVRKLHGGPYENLVSFLPGKAGSGASTVALHTGRMVAQEMGKKVFLLEGDLHSGVLSAMLNVNPKVSVREALANAGKFDQLNWQRAVTSVAGVDFMLTDTSLKDPIPAWTHYYQILRFAAPKYDLMIMDLPEVINMATAETVRRSRTVFVVSTPELASLKLTKQRCEELKFWGVDPARVQVLLNRGHKSDIQAPDAERMLGCKVAATFPNDYKTVRRATSDAAMIEKRSDLGEAYMAFARTLMGAEVEKKSFMGMFRK